MKHNLTITLVLLSFFLLAQVTGLWLINSDSKISIDDQGKIVVSHGDTSLGERPQTEGFGSFLYLIIGITIGTLIVLVLVKFRKANIWRYWFFLAVWMALSVSIGVFVKLKIFFDYDVAMLIALVLAVWKIWKPNIIIHNVTEVLVYSGIAVLLVPIFDVFWAIMLLIAISLYDMYAVWKSKHMIKMAKFQTKSNVFAGLMIPYSMKDAKMQKVSVNAKTPKKLDTSKMPKAKSKTAILGGGDVVFPLIFTGAVMEGLLREGLTKSQAFMQSSIMIVTTTIALALLFFFAKKDRFYPAMPFVTLGCLVGWVIVLLI
jgi:presenilin-like A22 family membrane protease